MYSAALMMTSDALCADITTSRPPRCVHPDVCIPNWSLPVSLIISLVTLAAVLEFVLVSIKTDCKFKRSEVLRYYFARRPSTKVCGQSKLCRRPHLESENMFPTRERSMMEGPVSLIR